VGALARLPASGGLPLKYSSNFFVKRPLVAGLLQSSDEIKNITLTSAIADVNVRLKSFNLDDNGPISQNSQVQFQSQFV